VTAPQRASAAPAASVNLAAQVEHFPALAATGVCRHAFIKRIVGIEMSHNKAEALRRLDAVHREIRGSLGISERPFVTAEQVHGSDIAVVADVPPSGDEHLSGYDGLITRQRDVALGIYVADCCAVYLVDPATPAIGLVHSGKKGSESDITGKAIDRMREVFGSAPEAMVVQLSPCIRPPHYEVDFAAQIREQCRARGVRQVHDSGICTACDLTAYYSFRAEKGKTGRMLALLALM
jgi:copper oxidase (laccase) domain-containing protein